MQHRSIHGLRRVTLDEDLPQFKTQDSNATTHVRVRSSLHSNGPPSRSAVGGTTEDGVSSDSGGDGEHAEGLDDETGEGGGGGGRAARRRPRTGKRNKGAGPLMDRFVEDSVMVAEQVASMRASSVVHREGSVTSPHGAPRAGLSFAVGAQSALPPPQFPCPDEAM